MGTLLPHGVGLVSVLLLLLTATGIGIAGAAPSLSTHRSQNNDAQSPQNTATLADDDLLQVHIIAHTHDDVGWKKTVDEYYYGTNTTIANGAVQYILDSVIASLIADPNKKFSYVEMAFFFRWWREQSDTMKDQVRNLVKDGRLEFVGGGWCMNDEAGTHYNAIIDQITFGHAFISTQFGAEYRPRMAWQVDPFGHSSVQATIFAQMGYDGLYFARADYEDKGLRINQSRLEMVWRGSPDNLGQESDLFTGMFYGGYGPPAEFQFDSRFADPMVVKDDPLLEDSNVKKLVDDFVKTVIMNAKAYRTKHLIFPMGSDFAYSAALAYFKNVDKLIKHVLADGRVNVFYSTPARYLDAVNAQGLTWELKTDDFFPYADRPHAYWTGYFTSRPALKRYVRVQNSLLQSCKQIESVHGVLAPGADSFALKEAMGVAQHHDAVSGTEQQHVANDYAKRLYMGGVQCQTVVAEYAATEVLPRLATASPPSTDSNVSPNGGHILFCDLLNISVCSLNSQDPFTVILYNPLGHERVSKIRIPVMSSAYSINAKAVLGHLVQPVQQAAVHARGKQGNLTNELVMIVNLAPISFVTIPVHPGADGQRTPAKEQDWKSLGDSGNSKSSKAHEKLTTTAQYYVISNEFYSANFSMDTGLLVSVTEKTSGRITALQQGFFWYESYNKTDKHDQASGAYIFRSNGDEAYPVSQTGTCATEFHEEEGVQSEARQKCGDFVYQTVGLYKGMPHIEFTFTVGPIPVGDHKGKEVVSRFTSGLNTGDDSTFYTDANGRELQERIYNHRNTWKPNMTVFEKVAGNFYPVNSRILLRDEAADTQLTVLTDSSQAGASLASGQVELMVHRRLLVDDHRGVNEPLNETGVDGKGLIVQGTHYLQLAPIKSAAALHRQLAQEIMLQPQIMFSEGAQAKSAVTPMGSSNSSATSLPKNVHLLTLQRLDFDPEDGKSTQRLVRFEHYFEVGEDEELSKPASVNVREYLKAAFGLNVSAMTEMTLSANQQKSQEHRLVWKVAEPGIDGAQPSYEMEGLQKRAEARTMTKRNLQQAYDSFSITLNPMEIRTFVLTLQ